MVEGKALGLNRSNGLSRWQTGEYHFVSSTLGCLDDELSRVGIGELHMREVPSRMAEAEC
jgi:hypothetical protein